MSDSGPIERITLFKCPNDEGLKTITDAFKKFKAENRRDGKPYIVSLQAGASQPDTAPQFAPLNRRRDYTFAVKTIFANKSDMDYYDNECPAHKELGKSVSGNVTERPTSVWFFDQVS